MRFTLWCLLASILATTQAKLEKQKAECSGIYCPSAPQGDPTSAPSASPVGPCPVGYAGTGGDDCSPCPENTFAYPPGQLECKPCPQGFASGNASRTCFQSLTSENCENGSGPADGDCQVCPVGTYSRFGNPCTSCDVGQIASEPGLTRCQKCEAGSQPSEDATSCESCEAGTFSEEEGTLCEPCEAGTFSGEGAEQCQACEEGTFSAPGATECRTCPEGFSVLPDQSGW